MTKWYPGTPGLTTTKPNDTLPTTTKNYYQNGKQVDPYHLNGLWDAFSEILVAGGQDGVNGDLLQALYGLFGQPINGPLNVYVSTSGSDTTGNGTSGNPWATLAHAQSVIASNYLTRGNNVTINVASGLYNGAQFDAPFSGGGLIFINGAGPSETAIGGTNTSAIAALSNTTVIVQNCSLTASGTAPSGSAVPGGWCLYASSGGQIQIENVAFSTATSGHMQINGFGSTITTAGGALGNYSIIGNAPTHMQIYGAGVLDCSTITLVGSNFSFTQGFINLVGPRSSLLCTGPTFNLDYATFTGSSLYFNIGAGCQIDTGGQPSNYFPGNTAGVTGTQGLYS